MPKYTRAQKLAVMRVRNVIYTSPPYPTRINEDVITVIGEMSGIDLKTIIINYSNNYCNN